MKYEQKSLLSMLREQSIRKRFAVAVCIVAIVMVLAVFWVLRISGLTLTDEDASSDAQQHTYTDASYDSVATVTDDTESGSETENTDNPTAGDVYTVTVTREDVSGGSAADYTIVYTDADGIVVASYSATDTNLTADTVYVYVIPQLGSFEVSAVYDTSTSKTYAGTVDTSTGFALAATENELLSGDFDITYTFTNKTYDTAERYYNFVAEVFTQDGVGTNSDPVYITVRSDNYGWLANQSDEDATITFSDGLDDWKDLIATMSTGTECTVNIVRSGNTFTFTTKVLQGAWKSDCSEALRGGRGKFKPLDLGAAAHRRWNQHRSEADRRADSQTGIHRHGVGAEVERLFVLL